MPDAVQSIAEVNPMTLAVDAVRALTTGNGATLAPSLGTLAWLVGLLAIFVPLAVQAFERS